MNTTFASSPWPVPPASRRDAGWRFGRELDPMLAPLQGWCFDLRRNVSLSPRQMLLAYGLLCALSLAVAAAFWSQGVSMVVLFTGAELMAVGLAMLIVARHAGDRELITLAGREMAVEQHNGHQIDRATFRAEWVRIEPAGGEGSLVELSGQGLRVRIGRHVRPELRRQLADELRHALRLQRASPTPVMDHEQKQ